ncbi:S8 family serine peptidase [Flavobacterium lacus]|nr:S8 family serine peptidase [Flavobacterium lacus]
MATIKGWPLTMQNSDGSFAELQGILENGNPLYFTTYNTGAASTSKINSLNTGGSLGLNLNGQNMIVGVWDQNVPLITHTDFGGRIIILDGSSVQTSFHSTHVTGTVLGAGTTNAPSKGMAFQSAGYILDWNNDYAEMSFEAGFGLLLSNHSYGQIATQLSEFQFGAYVSRSRQLDEIAFAAPYYLSVHAAGNDRNDNNQTVNPTKGGYDLLNGNKTSKNTLVVAAVNQVTNYTGPSSVAISSFSSYGPTDDNRVKPDISAKGVNVISTSNASISSHGPSSGTSMASPVVTGGLLLIQQHYSNLNQGNFMKSSSLRGLACHTADEAGAWDGPDPIYGWGLFNAEKAAQLITNKAAGLSIIDERTLNQGQTYTKVVNATGNAPLEVTICWTDRPGAINSGVVDSSTPVLVNNLDVRILKNDVVHFPWRLGNSHTDEAIRADNNVDNIEKVEIDNASGEYTIVVSHKGNLTGGSQEYALLVSGINENLSLDTVNTNNFSLTPNPVSDRLVVNSNQLYESNIICYIYDLQGRLVDTFNADFTQDSTYEIDVTSLSSGVYVLKAQGDDVQFSKKFVKK